jgi:hypothetical protein
MNPGQNFRVAAFVPIISLPKQTTLVLAPFYRNHLHWDFNPQVMLTEVFVIFLNLFRDRMLK